MAARPYSTVSGPGVDRQFSEGPAVAMSAAINIAQRLPMESTLYVRDERGEGYGRVERLQDGTVSIYRTGKDRT